jgi:hypothetical protein
MLHSLCEVEFTKVNQSKKSALRERSFYFATLMFYTVGGLDPLLR